MMSGYDFLQSQVLRRWEKVEVKHVWAIIYRNNYGSLLRQKHIAVASYMHWNRTLFKH